MRNTMEELLIKVVEGQETIRNILLEIHLIHI